MLKLNSSFCLRYFRFAGVVLVDAKHGKRIAWVWDHFWEHKDDDGNMDGCICKLCGPTSEPLAWCNNTSNLRSHMSCCHKTVFAENEGPQDPAINVAAEAATWLGAAKAPELPGHKRDAIHRRVALWIARRKRPQSICETDTELRDIFDFVLNGSYTLPTHKLVQQNILKLSTEGRAKFKALQAELKADGVLPSISGYIWSENGIALFGILAYWIDGDGRYFERLVGTIPFSEVRHTGAEILLATKKVLADMLIGEYVVDTKDEGKIVNTVSR
ncbi:hypothetical protein CYMTET_44264 [Cymbomonas tetramitiformis]|uniref:BED-type domain-containing protein n=1 Tax=Cymbomonas tetramitiformis TaxID=36881 RepID=A0AAE0C279_9CHLO|nr:hypothetical protein CYMTET_44264 [Cymbomonas tetramitiformis]